MAEADLRARARRLESELDSKLVQLSRLEGASPAYAALAQEIERTLADLGEANDAMSREAATSPGGSATAMHKLQRHREILHDLQQEFSKAKTAQKAATERSQLLSSVRDDIREHRATTHTTDALLRERNAIGASCRAADEVLAQAAANRDALATQRGGFGTMSGKLSQLSSLAPQINSLLGAIQRRQKRDKIILGVVIGLCTALLLWSGFG